MELSLDDLVPLPAYGEQRRHLFPSDASIEWFKRQNKAELVDEEALLMLAGRWMANPQNFDKVVLRVGQRAASRRMGGAND